MFPIFQPFIDFVGLMFAAGVLIIVAIMAGVLFIALLKAIGEVPQQ